MSEHDATLAEVDRLGRAAASALRDEIETHVDIDKPAAHTWPPPEPRATAIDQPARAGSRRGARRRTLAAAATVAAVAAAVGAVVVVAGDDDTPDVSSSGHADYLLPGWLPAGLEPAVALDGSRSDMPGALGGDIVVYGDPDADDPWAATLAVVHLVIPADTADEWQPDDGETVTVAGHEATLSETEGSGFGRTSAGWQVQWRVDDGVLAVGGSGLSRQEVLAAADAATASPPIAGDALPDNFTELGRGPVDAAAPSGYFISAGSGLAVTYTVPSEGDEGRTMVAVIQRPGPTAAVDLLRLSYADSDATRVRGQHGAIGRADGQIVVQWAEPNGQLISVIGYGLAEDAVLQVADRLRPAGSEEVAALLAEHAAPAAGEFDEVPAGQVEVASGDMPSGGRWRVVADPAADEALSALTVERVSDSGSSSGSSSSGTEGLPEPPPLELSSDSGDGSTIVYGVVHEDATSVTIEVPGRDPIALGLHDVAGWTRKVVAALVPDLGGSEATAVARAADGRELGRVGVFIGPEPLLPDGTTDGASADGDEECVTLADGATECSVSESSGVTDTIPADG